MNIIQKQIHFLDAIVAHFWCTGATAVLPAHQRTLLDSRFIRTSSYVCIREFHWKYSVDSITWTGACLLNCPQDQPHSNQHSLDSAVTPYLARRRRCHCLIETCPTLIWRPRLDYTVVVLQVYILFTASDCWDMSCVATARKIVAKETYIHHSIE